MEPVSALAIVVVVLLVLLTLETPIAWALGLSGVLGLVLTDGWARVGPTLGSEPMTSTGRVAFVVIPMYLLLGTFAARSGMSEQVFSVAARLTRRLRGGTGLATVLACGGFAAVSGSSVATAATMSRLAIGPMVRQGYPRSLAAGIVAAGGTLGALIPPSVILIILGIATGESIGRLLTAGILPGVLSILIYGGYILWAARAIPSFSSAPDQAGTSVTDVQDATWLSQPLTWVTYLGALRVVVLFAIVVAGIYGGLFTVTESAAIAAIVAFVFLVLSKIRDRRVRLRTEVAAGLAEASSLTSMAFAVLVGAAIFTVYIVSSGIPREFTEWALQLPIPSSLLVVLLLASLIPLGMALDPLSIILITMPLMHPVVTEMGYSGIWFVILAVKMIELGMITPPVGLNIFVVAGATDEVDVGQAFRGIAPFAALDVVTTAILFLVPAITLFLPMRA